MEDEIRKDLTPRLTISPNSSIPNKLLEFQKRVSAISKDSVNPFFKSKYFDVNTVIDTIKPILNELGIVILQPFTTIRETNRILLVTTVTDGNNTLAYSELLLPQIEDVQKFGAAITYFRRYSLVSLLLLQGEEDNDGNPVKKNPVKVVNGFKPTMGIDLDTSKVTHLTQNPAPSTMSNGQNVSGVISKAQAMFIKSLRTQLGIDQITDEELRGMTSQMASDEIKRLQEQNGEIVI